jgi:hypothetical protein
MQFAAELDGSTSVSWTVLLRVRDGKTRATLAGYFGHGVREFDHVPTLAEVQPAVEEWLSEVHERRVKKGKA